jgi:hypothetical protein
MMPSRFRLWAEQTIKDAKSPAIARVESGGIENVPEATRVIFETGAELHVQWVRTSTPDGDAKERVGEPTTGEPPLPVDIPELPAAGRLAMADVEAHLAALLNNGGNPELIEVKGYSRAGRGSERQPHGLTVRCHSGAALYGLFRHALPAGQKPGDASEFGRRNEI